MRSDLVYLCLDQLPMIIKSLYLKNYKRFADKTFNFSSGLNVITGQNEQGKSTIADAILDALFTDPATKSKNTAQRIQSWQGQNKAFLALEFETESNLYRLEKDFAQGSVVLINLDKNTSIEGFLQVSNELQRLLGIPAQDIYLSTSFIRHKDLLNFKSDKEFSAALQNAVSSSNEGGAQAVIAELENRIKDLRKGLDRLAKNPGEIKQTEELVASLETQLQEKKSEFALLLEAKKSGKESTGKLEDVENKITALRELIENHKKREEAEAKIAELKERLNETESQLKTVEESNIKIKQFDIQLQQFSAFVKVSDLDAVAREITEVATYIKNTEIELQEMPLIPKPQQFKKQVSINSKQILSSAVIIFVSLALALSLNSPVLLLVGLALALVLFFALKTKEADQQTDESARIRIENQIAHKNEMLEKTQLHLQNLLSKFSVDSEQDFYTRKADYKALHEQKKELENRISGLLGNKKIDDINKEQIEILTEIKSIEHNVLDEKVRAAKLDSQAFLAKRRELDLLLLEQGKLKEESTASKVRSQDAQVDSEVIAVIEEKLGTAKSRLDYYLRQEQVYNLALQKLKEAISHTAKSVQSKVSEYIEKYLPVITAGRYKDARLLENFSLEVFSSEKNDWLDPTSALSAGTVDQIYFVTRLALIKTLHPADSLPIILDDPFVTFDAKRREQAGVILKELMQNHQILFFSHYLEYEEWGDNILHV